MTRIKSRFWRAWTRCASARACISAPTDARGLNHLVSRWWITASTRRWQDTVTSGSLQADGGIRVKGQRPGHPDGNSGKNREKSALGGTHHASCRRQVRRNGYKGVWRLHGVGVSVVNALSTHLTATVARDGQRHRAMKGHSDDRRRVCGKIDVKPEPRSSSIRTRKFLKR